ncbi:MAG TPA: DUF503 domain-containing protein, partial [Baekduia sp.]|nr:DUF503 domain-containing protein [Baekduia sp.]
MHAAAVEYDLHIPTARSLKAKRAVVRPIVEGLRQRCSVSAAEVAHHDQWQRAVVAIAAVASTHAHLCELLDGADRFVWSHPEV